MRPGYLLQSFSTAYSSPICRTNHATRGDLDQAEQMHRKALEIDKRLGNQEGMAQEYGNIGSILLKRNNKEGARGLWMKARQIYSTMGVRDKLTLVRSMLDELDAKK